MDERLTIKGGTTFFKGKIIDHNLNPLQWWITKHNFYSNKESTWYRYDDNGREFGWFENLVNNSRFRFGREYP